MKKLLCIAAAAAALASASCTPLDRLNPTDPAADNYIGMHYMGTIGDFSQLNDFTFAGDTLWATGIINTTGGGTAPAVATYYPDGTLNYYFTRSNISSPTGICSDGAYFYLLCTDPGAPGGTDIQKYDPSYVSGTAAAQPPDYAGDYRFRCAVNPGNGYLYLTGTDSVTIFDTASNSMAASFGSSGTADGQFSAISDIEVHGSGAVVVADSGLNRISIFTSTGVFIRKIVTSFAFSGIGLDGDSLYIPASDGIHKLSFDTGAELLLFGNYGEGNGKVSQAGPCEAYGGKVYAGSAEAIRVFGE